MYEWTEEEEEEEEDEEGLLSVRVKVNVPTARLRVWFRVGRS